MEIDLDVNRYGNGTTIFLCRIELPEFDAFNGLFIQSHSQRVHDLRAMDASIRTDHHIQANHTLILGFSRLFGKLRLGGIDGPWGAHAVVAKMENTRTHARAAMAGTHAAAIAAADTAANPDSIGRCYQFGE